MTNTKCRTMVVSGLVRQGTFVKRANRKGPGHGFCRMLGGRSLGTHLTIRHFARMRVTYILFQLSNIMQ